MTPAPSLILPLRPTVGGLATAPTRPVARLALQALLSQLLMLGSALHAAPWLTLNHGDLIALRTSYQAHDPAATEFVEGLVKKADLALAAPLESVVSKSKPAPGGNPHDYVSLSKYYWPDPKRPGGLPYIRRDGEVNPEVKEYDAARMERMAGHVKSLALAWALTGRDDYGQRAAQQLRTWFLDSATRMSPHLNYGQLIPGKNDGSPWGIIESQDFPLVLDAATLLLSNTHPVAGDWTTADQTALTAWMVNYLGWLRGSTLGRKEENAENNHGTWWDVQVVSLALFTGDTDTARVVCEQAKIRRLAAHIATDGRLPEELTRTLSLDYSVCELEAQARLAALARLVGIDLWHCSTADGRSFKKALDYLLPFLTTDKPWPHPQIRPPSPTLGWHLLLTASRGLADPGYAEALAANQKATQKHIDLFLPVATTGPIVPSRH